MTSVLTSFRHGPGCFNFLSRLIGSMSNLPLLNAYSFVGIYLYLCKQASILLGETKKGRLTGWADIIALAGATVLLDSFSLPPLLVC